MKNKGKGAVILTLQTEGDRYLVIDDVTVTTLPDGVSYNHRTSRSYFDVYEDAVRFIGKWHAHYGRKNYSVVVVDSA